MAKLLKDRNFALLWTAVLVSGIGDVLYTVGIMVTIFETSGSALQTAGVMAASLLPIFLLSPVAGAMVDRYSRRRVMVTADLVRATLVTLLLVFVQGGQLNLWLIYLVVAGLGAMTAFYTPARMAILPAIVRRDDLARANGIMSGTVQGTQAFGYILGGFLVVWVSLRALVLLDLLTFLVSAALISSIRLEAVQRERRTAQALELPLWQSVKEGVRYLRHHQLARALVTMEWLEHIPHGVWTSALMLVFVEQALNADAQVWGLQNGAFYTGVMLGAVLATAVSGVIMRWPGRIIIVNAFLMGLLTVVYAQTDSIAVTIIISVLYGPTFALRDVAQNTLLQTSVDEDKLGRVYSLREMGWNVVFLLSGLTYAALADLGVPIRAIYMLAAVGYLLTAVYALSSRALRRSRIGTVAVIGNP
ncbi:MAG TPA: MFS transporter [Chloroflexota bacterium]|nr:MFS transporter [Chloroflexota bacterium]HUM68385.1 MFS transporter [Chloroflexota bacterium]